MIGANWQVKCMTPEQERNYNHYNQSETVMCQKCGTAFTTIHRARIGTDLIAHGKRKYCYDCSPPKNINTQNSQDAYNASHVQIRIRKSTVRRMKSKRIPPESYDDLLNRVFDEHHNGAKK